jgi:hypothetical protein
VSGHGGKTSQRAQNLKPKQPPHLFLSVRGNRPQSEPFGSGSVVGLAGFDCKEIAFAPAAPEAVRTRTGVGE